MKNNHVFSHLLRMRSPKKVDQMFDVLIAGTWMAGNLDANVPVDEAREVFEHIKKLLHEDQTTP